MFSVRISLVILVSIHICPSSYAICENYYIIMEKKNADYAYYSPITKENITRTLSDIQINNETNTFDINCVLDLKCDSIDAVRPRLLVHENINKTIGTDEMPANVLSKENPSNNFTSLDGKEDGSFDLETTTANTLESGNKFARNFGSDSNKSSDVSVKNGTNFTETNKEIIKKKDTISPDAQDNKVRRKNVTEISSDNNNNTTNSTNKEIIQKEDTNSTDVQDNEVISKNVTEVASDSNYNTTTIALGDYSKYNPEESKTLATKVVAGIIGAAATVLVTVGATKLIQYYMQRGVYRIPDP